MTTASTSPLAAPALRSTGYRAFTLRDLLNAIFYHRRALLIAFLIPVAIGLVAALLSKPSYVAQARLLVLYGSDYVFHPGNSAVGSDITLDRNQVMQGEQQILTSSTLAMETLKAVGLNRVYPGAANQDPNALAIAALRFGLDLTVTNIPLSNVIELSFRSLDRQVAADVLKELIAQYLQRRNVVFDKNDAGASQTGATQTGAVQTGAVQSGAVQSGADAKREQFADRLHRAEAALAQFGAEHGISNLDEQVSLLLKQKADNVGEQNQTDQAIRETSARLDSLHRQLADVPQSVQVFAESTRSQQAQGLTDSLLKLEATRRDLRSRYQDDFPLVQDVDTQIAALKAQLNASATREGAVARQGRNTVYDELHSQEITLQAQLQGLQARRRELGATADSLQHRLDELNGFGRTYRDLQRTRDVLDESYRAIARSNEETQLAGALERARGGNVSVVQPPEVPLIGRSARKTFFGVGLLLGLLAAAATLAVLNAIRQVFISVHDVERALELPVLAAVPLAGARPPILRTGFGLRRPAAAPLVGTPHPGEQPSFST